MSAKTVSLRMDEDKLARIDQMAELTGHSRNYHINEAVNRYLAYEEWFVLRVEAAIEDVKQGQFISHDEVKANIQARIDQATSK